MFELLRNAASITTFFFVSFFIVGNLELPIPPKPIVSSFPSTDSGSGAVIPGASLQVIETNSLNIFQEKLYQCRLEIAQKKI